MIEKKLNYPSYRIIMFSKTIVQSSTFQIHVRVYECNTIKQQALCTSLCTKSKVISTQDIFQKNI